MAANSKPNQILELTPAHEIRFEGPFNTTKTSYLQLHNPTQRRVSFKVKTTAPRRYSVRPNSGFVSPNANVKIAIMYQPNESEGQVERSKHKFMVQSTFTEDDSSSLEFVWANAKPSQISDSKLRCIFETPNATQASSKPALDPIADIDPLNPLTGGWAPPDTTMATPASDSSLLPKESSNTKTSTNDDVDGQATAQAHKNVSTADASPKKSSGPTKHSSHEENDKLISPPEPTSETSNLSQRKRSDSEIAFERNRSVVSSHNLTASFIQPMSDDYKVVIVSLVMLFIGVILGKYVI